MGFFVLILTKQLWKGKSHPGYRSLSRFQVLATGLQPPPGLGVFPSSAVSWAGAEVGGSVVLALWCMC